MIYEFYMKQPMEMSELKLNKLISKSPHLLNSLDRSVIRPFIKIYSNTPVEKYQMYIVKIPDDYNSICTDKQNSIDIIKPILL